MSVGCRGISMYQQKLSGLGHNPNSPRGGSFWGGGSPLAPVRSDGSWSLRAVTPRNPSSQSGAPSSTARPSNLSRSSSTTESRMANTSPKRRLTLPPPPPDGQENSQQPLSLAMLTKQGSGAQSPILGPHSPDQRNASPKGPMSRPYGDTPLRTNMAPLSRANGPPAPAASFPVVSKGPLESGSPTKSSAKSPVMTVSSAGAQTRSGGIGRAPSLLPPNSGMGLPAKTPPGPFQQGLQMSSAPSAGRHGRPGGLRAAAVQAPAVWQSDMPVGPGPLAAPMVQQQPVSCTPPQASPLPNCLDDTKHVVTATLSMPHTIAPDSGPVLLQEEQFPLV